MKQCPKCAAKNDNSAAFCQECGESLAGVTADQSDLSAKAGAFLNKAKEAANAGAQKAAEAAAAGAEKAQRAIEAAEKKAEESKARRASAGGWDNAVEIQSGPSPSRQSGGTSAMFIDQSEHVVASIGSNYLQNFLSGGPVAKSVGVLTQKRFYYKGKNFSGAGKNIKSATEEGVVSIEDITFTKFTHIRHTGFLLFAILMTVLGFPAAAVPNNSVSVLACLVIALPFYILYFVKRSSLFLIAFPGGGFAFDTRWYPIADIRDFQRQLHLLKDHRKEGAAV